MCVASILKSCNSNPARGFEDSTFNRFPDGKIVGYTFNQLPFILLSTIGSVIVLCSVSSVLAAIIVTTLTQGLISAKKSVPELNPGFNSIYVPA